MGKHFEIGEYTFSVLDERTKESKTLNVNLLPT
jgi:hypothetical protein